MFACLFPVMGMAAMGLGGCLVVPIHQQNGQQPLQLCLLLGIQRGQVRGGSAVVEEVAALHQHSQGPAGHFPTGLPLAMFLGLQSKVPVVFDAVDSIDRIGMKSMKDEPRNE